MKSLLLFLLFGVILAHGAEMPPDAVPERLWAAAAPGAKGDGKDDIPTLSAYFPASSQKNMPAVVIYPGGGYHSLMMGHEGKDFALFLNQRGIAAFVVAYRLYSKGYYHPEMLLDAARAVRTVRYNAEKWGIDPARIGVMGSSAGGHLAATIATRFDKGDPAAADPVDRVSSRPDFAIICYPVISIRPGKFLTSLLGPNPTEEQIKGLSADLNVTPNTSPCFIWHTADDRGVSPRNSIDFARALVMNKVPVDLHIYEQGGHGMGLGTRYPYRDPHPWTRDLDFWFAARKLLP